MDNTTLVINIAEDPRIASFQRQLGNLRAGYIQDTNTLSALIDRAKAQHLADLRTILSFETKAETDEFIRKVLDDNC